MSSPLRVFSGYSGGNTSPTAQLSLVTMTTVVAPAMSMTMTVSTTM